MSKKLSNYIAALKYGAVFDKVVSIAKAAATAFTVGPNGATNPTLQVDTSTASAATGVKVKGAAAAAGVDVSVISSGTNENLTINAKGSGTIQLGSTSTGKVIIGDGTTGTIKLGDQDILTKAGGQSLDFLNNDLKNVTSILVTGQATLASAVATPAGGSTSARLLFGTTAGFGIYCGSGVPTVSAAQGSLYLRSDGSSTSTRLYVNTNGSTTWTNVTTAA